MQQLGLMRWFENERTLQFQQDAAFDQNVGSKFSNFLLAKPDRYWNLTAHCQPSLPECDHE